MRFLFKLINKFEKNMFKVTEQEIEEELKEYEKYVEQNKEKSIIRIKKSVVCNEIIDQVSTLVYRDNINQDNAYNEYDNWEELWTSIRAS